MWLYQQATDFSDTEKKKKKKTSKYNRILYKSQKIVATWYGSKLHMMVGWLGFMAYQPM